MLFTKFTKFPPASFLLASTPSYIFPVPFHPPHLISHRLHPIQASYDKNIYLQSFSYLPPSHYNSRLAFTPYRLSLSHSFLAFSSPFWSSHTNFLLNPFKSYFLLQYNPLTPNVNWSYVTFTHRHTHSLLLNDLYIIFTSFHTSSILLNTYSISLSPYTVHFILHHQETDILPSTPLI